MKNIQKSLRALTPKISDEDEDPYAAESWMVHGALDMAEHLAKNLTSDSYYMHHLCQCIRGLTIFWYVETV